VVRVDTVVFEKEIQQRYTQLYGADVVRSCFIPLKRTLRVNTLRITAHQLRERLEKQRFELSAGMLKDSFVIERERKHLGATLEHLLGYFYIQELTSMIPPRWLNPLPTDVVLDMSAAPGGKTTYLSEIMKNQGTIVAIDTDKRKNEAMLANLERMGTRNVTFFNFDALQIKDLNMTFSKILLDAPCSASGIVMKDKNVARKLTLSYIKKYAEKQKSLLSRAADVLGEGGVITYSTCSIDPLENEGVTDYAQSVLGLTLKRKKQFLPNPNGLVGFYVGELKK